MGLTPLDRHPCPSCAHLTSAQEAQYRCPECGCCFDSRIDQRLLRFADKRWVARLLLGCRLIKSGFTALLCCYAAMLSIVIATLNSRELDTPNWWVEVLEYLTWSMVLGFLVAVGLLWLGLLRFVAPNPRGKQWWSSLLRWQTNSAAVAVLILWLVTAQVSVGPSGAIDLIPLIGAVVLSIHAIAILQLTASLKARCVNGLHCCNVEHRSTIIASLICVLIFAISAFDHGTERLRAVWILWGAAIAFAAHSLENRLEQEVHRPQ